MKKLFPLLGVVVGLVLLQTPDSIKAQTPLDEEAPWPRVRSTNGNTVTLHLPQVERWTSANVLGRTYASKK